MSDPLPHDDPSPEDALRGMLRPLFWDCDVEALDWTKQREFILGRILVEGSWPAVCWLRRRVGDAALAQWIRGKQGGPLSPPQLRFWQLILNLPQEEVDRWLAQPARRLWQERVRR